MTTTWSEAYRAQQDHDDDGEVETSIVVLRDGSRCRIMEPDSDWEHAAFDPPPADGWWVLEGIEIVGEEKRSFGYSDDYDLVPVISGTWRPATADDHDEAPE